LKEEKILRTDLFTQIIAATDAIYPQKPWYDGAANAGTTIKYYGPTVGNVGHGTYTSLQGGDPTANRAWRLPIAAPPSAGTTSLLNVDEYGNMGLVAQAPFLTTASTFASFTGTKIPDTSTVAASFQALETAVEGKQAAMTAASQAEMEAGTESALRSMSPLRMTQAIAAWMAAGKAFVLGYAAGFDPSATDYKFGYDSMDNSLKMGDEDGSGSKTWYPENRRNYQRHRENVWNRKCEILRNRDSANAVILFAWLLPSTTQAKPGPRTFLCGYFPNRACFMT
jgi:hypothetical protein